MNHANGIAGSVRLAFVAALATTLLCGNAWADPPGRAGRVSALEGSATLQQATAPPVPAALNWPVTTGDRIVTAPGSRLELRIGSTALQLDGDSTLDVDALDDQRLTLRLEHGRVALHARSNELARALTLATPQGRLSPQGAGRWRIDAGFPAGTTSVAAFDVPADFVGEDDADTHVTVPAGRLMRITGVRALSLQNLPIDALAFDRWVAERDAHDSLGGAAQYVSPEMTGAEGLEGFGSWSVTADYGPVWYPDAIGVDWAPYRVGRWAWVAPWGWTWVDAAPWGFAPFHYGRWALIGDRWGWVPGTRVATPVYAPAVVGWIGRRDWSVSASVGPSVGWFPLAPFEPYYPGLDASPAYLRRLNVASVHDVTRITTVDVTSIHYANRELTRAVTVVPVSAMASGRDVARVAVPVRDAKALAGWPTAARVPRDLPQPMRGALAEPPARRDEVQAHHPSPADIGHAPPGHERAASLPPQGPQSAREEPERERHGDAEVSPEIRARGAERERERERDHEREREHERDHEHEPQRGEP